MDAQRPMMKCGHSANARDSAGTWVCAICHPAAEARETDPSVDLTSRQAACSYTLRTGYAHDREAVLRASKRGETYRDGLVPSHSGLPFFEYRPGEPVDTYYCGCWGWD